MSVLRGSASASLVIVVGLLFGGFVLGPVACSSDPAAAAAAACQNGVQDNGETAVDCGGQCGKCAGDGCTGPADCASGKCTNGKCEAPLAGGPGTPTDGKKNNGETDVDCGGPNAPGCTEGKGCEADTDCADKYCKPAEKKCIAPRNDDGIKNGTETDIDCGGASGKKCAEGLACTVDADCNGACSYQNKCIDTPSCKPHFGGDTCGGKPLHPGELGDPAPTATQESCCRSLPVPGYTDPKNPGKMVFLDKYEVTAGRIRAFLAALTAELGKPDIKGWIAAHTPPIWTASWNQFLPSGTDTDEIVVPRAPSSPPEPKPWNRNIGTNFVFGGPLYIYVHGHNCENTAGSFGFPTFWYPDAILTARGEVARAAGLDGNGGSIPAQEALDVKSMGCIPSAVLAAFCHWDGGQLATDEVLDFVTNAPSTLNNAAGCGSRCAPIASIQASTDSGNDNNILYRFPNYTANHEGTSRIATPGRVHGDKVRINANDEPWMDVHGNVHEIVLDMNGATFTGNFGIKYRGIGYNSARNGGNSTAPAKYTFPEYKAAYSGGRCMRWK